jgi:Fe-S-cluster containining protein
LIAERVVRSVEGADMNRLMSRLRGMRAALKHIDNKHNGDQAAVEKEYNARRMPCPFLTPNTFRCSIYPVRPMQCRVTHATDADICAESKLALATRGERVPVPTVPQLSIVNDTLQEAFNESYTERVSHRGTSDAWGRVYLLPLLLTEIKAVRRRYT